METKHLMNKTGNYFEKSSYLARKLHGKNQPENTKIVGKSFQNSIWKILANRKKYL